MSKIVFLISMLLTQIVLGQESCRTIVGKQGDLVAVSLDTGVKAPNQCGKTCYLESGILAAELWASAKTSSPIKISRATVAHWLVLKRARKIVHKSDLEKTVQNIYDYGVEHKLIAGGMSSVVIKLLNEKGWPLVTSTPKDQRGEDAQVKILLQTAQKMFESFKRKIFAISEGLEVKKAIETRGNEIQIAVDELMLGLQNLPELLTSTSEVRLAQFSEVGLIEKFNRRILELKSRPRLSQADTQLAAHSKLQKVKHIIDAGRPVLVSYTHRHGTEILSLDSILSGKPKLRGGPSRSGRHSAVITGYVEDLAGQIQYIEILNSWGEGFGDHGYFYLPIAQLAQDLKALSTHKADGTFEEIGTTSKF